MQLSLARDQVSSPKTDTPWKINMEPENDGLEDDFPFQLGGFHVNLPGRMIGRLVPFPFLLKWSL